MDITKIAQDVLGWMASEGVELSQDLGAAEVTLRDWMLRIGSRALELHLDTSQLGYEGSSRACECGANQRFVGYRTKTMATLLGTVPVKRAYYHHAGCGASALPYDAEAGLGTGQVSPGLAKAATVLGIHEPFEQAARMLSEITGLPRLSERTVERLTEQVGAVAAAEEERLAEQMKTWEEPAAEVKPECLYVATDGVMVNEQDGWHEAKTVTCYWEKKDETREARYAVRFESAAVFAAFVWSLACQCGLSTAQKVVLLGDGAAWIWEHVRKVLGEQVICIVDWYHAMEHVWACGNQLYGEGSQPTVIWVKTYETLLWEGNVRELLRRLEAEQARARSPDDQKALQSLITYLSNQDDRLAYDRFRAQGLDIGSGRVEAACKSVVSLRMKRTGGMRWSAGGAQTTLSLRVVWLNGRWEELWARRPLANAA